MGDTHLILADGATLECVHVKLEGDRKLYIYGETENGTGTLKVDNAKDEPLGCRESR